LQIVAKVPIDRRRVSSIWVPKSVLVLEVEQLLHVTLRVVEQLNAARTITLPGPEINVLQQTEAKQVELPEVRSLKRSIAVLPFENLSDAGNDKYFADGIQDEILSNLAKISRLNVISRTSVSSYDVRTARNIRAVGKLLGVANIVEGTVRRNGNRVRITVRLVKARTDKTLWSESYDRALTDKFAVQVHIARAVVTEVTKSLIPSREKANSG
jgi:TolB-like protein